MVGEKMKLNLGCGKRILEGYVNCDELAESGVDKIVNLDKRLPFDDDVAEEVLLENVIEHVNEPYKLMVEVWRVSKNGAKVILEAPHTSSGVLAGSLAHKRTGINAYSFETFKVDNAYNYYSPARFKIVKMEYLCSAFPFWKFLNKHFFEKHIYLTEFVFANFLNFNIFKVELEVVKHWSFGHGEKK
jgi:predicted SAM-dependent methyltransferase